MLTRRCEYDSVDPDDVVVTIPANDAVGVTVSQLDVVGC